METTSAAAPPVVTEAEKNCTAGEDHRDTGPTLQQDQTNYAMVIGLVVLFSVVSLCVGIWIGQRYAKKIREMCQMCVDWAREKYRRHLQKRPVQPTSDEEEGAAEACLRNGNAAHN